MDPLAILTALWVGSTIFYWAALGFALVLVIFSVYILVTDWDGSMKTFEQLYGKVKQWRGK